MLGLHCRIVLPKQMSEVRTIKRGTMTKSGGQRGRSAPFPARLDVPGEIISPNALLLGSELVKQARAASTALLTSK